MLFNQTNQWTVEEFFRKNNTKIVKSDHLEYNPRLLADERDLLKYFEDFVEFENPKNQELIGESLIERIFGGLFTCGAVNTTNHFGVKIHLRELSLMVIQVASESEDTLRLAEIALQNFVFLLSK